MIRQIVGLGSLGIVCICGEVHAQNVNDVIPPNFRGKITYVGSAQGTVSEPARAPRRLNLGSLISAMSSNSRPIQLGITFEVEYDGPKFNLTFVQRGELPGRGSATGTRQGNVCQVVTDVGVRYTATCTANVFNAPTSFSDARGRSYKFNVETGTTALVDYAERDRQQAIAAKKAEAERQAAAARYAALPDAGPALTKKLDGFVQTDSQGWAMNRYNPGTVRNVKIIDGTVKSGSYVMRGDYTYNGGSQGWVMAKMSGGQLDCIQFWDAMVGCRGLRTPEQGQAMRNAFVGALASGGSSAPASNDYPDECGLVVVGTNAAGGAIYGGRC